LDLALVDGFTKRWHNVQRSQCSPFLRARSSVGVRPRLRYPKPTDLESKEYIAELREKYVRTRAIGKKKESVKGVGQLARNIRMFSEGKLQSREVFGGAKRILPVLVVSDEALNAPLHAWFFASAFRAELDAAGEVGAPIALKGVRVEDLILVSIDDLENLEGAKLSFMDYLLVYADACADRTMSFHNFLALQPEGFHRSQALKLKADELLAQPR
jgi:hypothetical protein